MKIILKVHKMHCKSCEVLLTDVVSEVPGTSHIQVDHKQGTLSLEYLDETTLTKVKNVIAQEGYKVL